MICITDEQFENEISQHYPKISIRRKEEIFTSFKIMTKENYNDDLSESFEQFEECLHNIKYEITSESYQELLDLKDKFETILRSKRLYQKY